MSKRDYYEILGVNKNASLEDIKRAYRELALRYHPDRVAADQKKEAEEKFKEISEAYAVLSDSNKRALYDQYGHAGIDQRFTAEDIFKGADFSSIFQDLSDFGFGGGLFDEIFGDFGFDILGRSRKRRGGNRGRDLEIEVNITLNEAASGLEKSINLPRYEPCATCQGTGAKSGTRQSTCPQCKGSGRMIVSSGFFQLTQTCSRCRGQGSIISTPCPDCHGEGRAKVTRKITLKIPPGVDTGSTLRIRGEGEAGTLSRGNLYVAINVKPHSTFRRQDNDIICEAQISVVKAILGGTIEVPTLNGKVSMKIPSGTQPNRIFRLRDKGIPDLHGRGRGDQLVRVIVKIPSSLTNQARRLIEEFAHATGESVDSKESIVSKIKKTFK